jgi:hypothetical protein
MLSLLRPQLLPGPSSRPTLTRLALLAAANPAVADSLLRDPIDRVATSHPHYALTLDARDQATIADIRAHARTVNEFLCALADVIDGCA